MSPSLGEGLRIGYSPYREDLEAPGDRRRFCRWADRRDLKFEVLRPQRRYDIVVLSARADIARWARHPSDGTKIIFDLIDSYFEEPRLQLRGLLRGTAKRLSGEVSRWTPSYRKAIIAMCRRADAVVCSTEEQRRAILPFSDNVHAILDIQTMAVGRVKDNYRRQSQLHVVWEGLPQTVGYLKHIADAWGEMSRTQPCVLDVVTDREYGRLLGRYWKAETRRLLAPLGPNVVLHEWSENRLTEVAVRADFAIIPVHLGDPFAVAKPENKLLLFWRLGLPVVAAATPAYARTMLMAGVDTLCRDDHDWYRQMSTLAADERLRRTSAAAGRTYAERQLGEAVMLARWDRVFASVLAEHAHVQTAC